VVKSEMEAWNKTGETISETPFKGLVQDSVLNIFTVVFTVVARGTISFFGIIFNVINIIVFSKQGFRDTVNISLFSLAISDMASLIPLLWGSVCVNPLFAKTDLPFDPSDILYITAGWPSVCFARISSWITAFITFERCLCIALPLKVKRIITKRTTIVVVVGIYVVLVASVVPTFYTFSLEPKYFPQRNKTKIGVTYTSNGDFLLYILSSINISSQLVCFFIVSVCTAILIHNLLVKSRWRRSAASASNQISLSNRDKKIVRMVLLISSIFIGCFLPSVVNFLVTLILAEYNMGKKYQNLFLINGSICISLAAMNSAVNIFVYYKMNSKYKTILEKILHRNLERN